MRKQPNISAPTTLNTQPPAGIITQVREYELITPLFGGGVEKSENDPLTPIRGSEIRGNLRFWWRACRGGQFEGKLAEMKKKEDEIWGAAYKKTKEAPEQSETRQKEQPVQIFVETRQYDTPIKPFRIERVEKDGELKKLVKPNAGIPSYAAFPLQPDQEELQQDNPHIPDMYPRLSFRLTISFLAIERKEVEAALWAWETFGGVGARTRRGFGSLRCTSIKENKKIIPLHQPSSTEAAGQWIQSMLKEFEVNGVWPNKVPHLSERFAEGTNFRLTDQSSNQGVMSVWSNLINDLKSFRQTRHISTTPRAKNPGRSMWPEPSTIRHYTEQSSTYHESPIPNPPIHKFPRAAFGLPIIFQFKNSNKTYPDNKRSEPRKTVLQIKGYERFASPLILKPISCPNGKFVGLALILEGTSLPGDQLELQTQDGTKARWDAKAFLENDESLTLDHTRRRFQTHLNKRTDILRAFLNYL